MRILSALVIIALVTAFAIWTEPKRPSPIEVEALKQKQIEELVAERKRTDEEAERRRQTQKEAEARCRESENCSMNMKMRVAEGICPAYVQRLAKNNYEWTNGFLAPKFEQWQWKDQKKGVATFFGDKIKFQNGFGAWIIHMYECDFDIKSDRVLGVRAKPGRL